MRKIETGKYIKLSKARFTPADTCFQAVRILDHAAELAIQTNDTKLMFKVADKFVQLASQLSPGDEEEYNEEEDESDTPKLGFGFGISA